jgi:hypothetical protein
LFAATLNHVFSSLALKAQPFQHVPLLSYIVISFERALTSRWEVTPLLLETIFAPFVKERPIWVMARAVLERLLDAPRLNALFARTAQQQ